MKNVWLSVSLLLGSLMDKSYQLGVRFEEEAYRRVSVHFSGVNQPENCANFLDSFEVSELFLLLFTDDNCQVGDNIRDEKKTRDTIYRHRQDKYWYCITIMFRPIVSFILCWQTRPGTF